MEPNADKTGVVFGVQNDLPVVGGNVAQKSEYDKLLGAGTMSRSSAACPCCSAIMKGEDIRYEGQSGRLRQVMTAAVYESSTGKVCRLPTKEDLFAFEIAQVSLNPLFEYPFMRWRR
jgi:putative DNA methylase